MTWELWLAALKAMGKTESAEFEEFARLGFDMAMGNMMEVVAAIHAGKGEDPSTILLYKKMMGGSVPDAKRGIQLLTQKLVSKSIE